MSNFGDFTDGVPGPARHVGASYAVSGTTLTMTTGCSDDPSWAVGAARTVSYTYDAGLGALFVYDDATEMAFTRIGASTSP